MRMFPFRQKLYTALHVAQVRLRRPTYRRALNRIIALTRPRGLPISEDVRERTRELEQNGFTNLGKPFNQSMLLALKNALAANDCEDPWHPEGSAFRLEDTPAATNNSHVIGVETIPESVAIANDPTVLAIVSDYLGCRPTIEHVLAWWSIAGRPAPIEEQNFHRDNPSVRFLKLFVYLTDVSDAEGAHVFVRGSHRSNKLLKPGRRFADEQVLAVFGEERITRFIGGFGTTFLEDTFGLHKGQVPTTSNRLIFQVTYSTLPEPSSLAYQRQADVSAYDPYINRLLNQRGLR